MAFNITRLFNDSLLQQTQGLDCHGNETLTSVYTKWLNIYLFLLTIF